MYVQVAPGAEPPVCKILDYGKFKYEDQKRKAEARKKQKTIDIKEIKMRPGIDDHDYDVKMKAMRRFLEEGDGLRGASLDPAQGCLQGQVLGPEAQGVVLFPGEEEPLGDQEVSLHPQGVADVGAREGGEDVGHAGFEFVGRSGRGGEALGGLSHPGGPGGGLGRIGADPLAGQAAEVDARGPAPGEGGGL